MSRFLLFSLLLFGSSQLYANSDISLHHQLPEDIPFAAAEQRGDNWLNHHQKRVNRHAWRTFISLMWPVNPLHRGIAHKESKLHDAGLRVWETWKEQYEAYPKDGSAPAPWNTKETLPAACQTGETENLRHLYRQEKVDDVLDAINQAVKVDGTLPGTLTDQHGKVVRYEIRMNRHVFDYIVENKLYNGEQQTKADKVDFPDGSILIKAAWRELTAETPIKERKQFMTRQACICDGDDCHRAKVAMVGFHIMHKTPNAPQWIWSTFEHVSNVHPTHGLPANFNNPNCQGQYCANNSQTPTGTPNQVTQILPLTPELEKLNHRMQQLFTGVHSVLSRYQLMSAQWPLPSKNKADPATVFNVMPTFSANTTMETFAQDTSSCMGCHVMSRSLRPDQFVSGDFSFTLNNAHPKPEGAICNSYDYANSVACSDEIILFDPKDLANYPPAQQKSITHGYNVASHTYEKLPNNVGNRLHCRSCHLHAGGDQNASWWVGMNREYPTAEKLQSRINGCFERSMNGKALCTPASEGVAGDCESNQDMSGIIAYMDWLTDTYKKKHNCSSLNNTGEQCNPPHGFPALTNPDVIGNPVQGKAIFDQKCAFCHGGQGEGRYASDTYFRPALWGKDSYNVSAGMAKTDKFARFVRWNMPYSSGGLLTDQEAQDLACFVDAHKRPGKTEAGNGDNPACLSPSNHTAQ